MNKRFLIFALALLILGVVVFFVAGNNSAEVPEVSQNNTQEEQIENTGEDVVITYTDSGYSPQNITISLGTTVVFINESSSAMWPATNIHPTHTIYPNSNISDCGTGKVMFDACGEISPGESWSFTFNEAGNWRYHNHIRATRGGVIVVE
ncbi:MAG: hypothetical protein WDZ40_03255 [Candidatus Spechtbacterales bacterium]